MPSPEMDAKYLLGVDGGGTKTHFSLATMEGDVVATHRGPASYYVDIGVDGVEAVLRNGVAAVLTQVDGDRSDIAAAYFGLPAFGENPTAEAQLRTLPRAILGHDRYACGNDMVCAWAGALGGADGINIVAGTGSIGYGEREGKSARCGGWGELFGDEGSAHWTAIQGLNLFTRMSDGRLPRSPLYHLFRTSLGLDRDIDVLVRYLEEDATRTHIASLAPLVSQAAMAGDTLALSVLQSAAAELALLAATLANLLGYAEGQPVPVSYSGGMFSMGDQFLGMFAARLKEARTDMHLVAPEASPQSGAVTLAGRLAREILTD